MVRTEPVEEHLGNLGISFGNQASPGKLVSPTPRKNFFLLQYKGIAVGDQVEIDGGTGSVVEYLKKGMIKVEIDGGADAPPPAPLEGMGIKALKQEAAARGVDLTGCAEKSEIVAEIKKAPPAPARKPTKDVDATQLVVTTTSEPLDLCETLVDAQAKANEPLDPMFAELPPDVLASLPPSMLNFEAPPLDALEVLPRKDDVVKICDGEERFWTLVVAVDGESIEALVLNPLVGDQDFAKPGTRIRFEKRHIYMIEAYLPMPKESDPRVQLALVQPSKGAERAIAHFRVAYREKVGDEKYQKLIEVCPPSFCPVDSKEEVEAWFRAEAKKDPSILDGSNGLDPDDLGIAIMMPLDQCGGEQFVFMDLGNMILMPRVAAACMTE